MRGSFLVELDEDKIVIHPIDNKGRQFQPLALSIESAASLADALQKAVAEAKVRTYN